MKVGSRSSPLAIAQVKEVQKCLKRAKINPDLEHVLFETQGDVDRKTPLSENLPDNFFTNTLDKALLNKKIDLAIHSAKDLPKELDPGLSILALTRTIDDSDSFVGQIAPSKLKGGARIGTSSPLRAQMIKEHYPKLKAVNIRGNIESRLEQQSASSFDQAVLFQSFRLEDNKAQR